MELIHAIFKMNISFPRLCVVVVVMLHAVNVLRPSRTMYLPKNV